MENQASIIYEQPITERIRIFLRLEQLFAQTLHFIAGKTVTDTRHAFFSLVDIMATIERVDIKGECIKELDRYSGSLQRLQELHGIDLPKLHEVLARNNQLIQDLHNVQGKLGQSLKDSELFNAVRHRMAIPGGPLNFDVPTFHFWLQEPVASRHAQLGRWMKEFESIYSSIVLILALTRESAHFETVVACSGCYEKTLSAQTPCQLIRVSLPHALNAYPEISAGKHHAHIRLKYTDNQGKPCPVQDDLQVDIACCQI